MPSSSDTTQPIGSVVLYGDCDILQATAILFRTLGWNVTVVSESERHAALAQKFSGFLMGAEISLEAGGAEGNSPANFRVHCTHHGAPPVVPPARAGGTTIELSGVMHDDGEDVWTTCSDLVAYMRSGAGLITRPRTGEVRPPFLGAGRVPSYFLAWHSVFLATATLETEERPASMQLSAQECLLSVLERTIGTAQLPQVEAPRTPGQRPGGRFKCLDGIAVITGYTQQLWQPLIGHLWRDEWADEEWWKEITGTPEQITKINGALTEFCATRTKEEVVSRLQGVGFPASYLAEPEDVFSNPQLKDHGFLTRSADGHLVFGRPYRLEVARQDPLLPASSRAKVGQPSKYLPLAGLTVCDLSWWWAGPWAGMCLAHLGATVIKVEGRTRLDPHRTNRPIVDGEGPIYNRAYINWVSARNKLSLTVNLKHPDGLQAVKDLISRSDVLISNFQPGTLERLGLGFNASAELVGARPFVYAALSGFGGTGPWHDYRSFGPNLAEFGAFNTLTGTRETGPIETNVALTDPLGGISGAALMMSSLRRARALNAPVFLDVAQFEVQNLMVSDSLRLGKPTGNRRPGDWAGTGVYACSGEDSWLAVHVGTRDQLNGLTALLELEESVSEPDLESALAAWAATHDKKDAAKALRSRGIDSSEVLSCAELLSDQSLWDAEFWYRTDPIEHELLMEHAPWRVDGRRTALVGRSPLLGEHNEHVLTKIVGYPESRARELQESGALD